jgi:tRNA U34 2-thiouridine synthase MnmA/TrmU
VSVESNVVHVCAGTHHPALYADSIEFRMQWVCSAMEELLDLPEADQPNGRSLPHLRVTCRIRHLQPLMTAHLVRSSNDGRYVLQLDRPTRAVTPGQMAVVYLGLVCLGGGPIERRGSNYLERNEPLPDRLYRGGHNDTSPLPSTATVLAFAAT